MMKDIKKMT